MSIEKGLYYNLFPYIYAATVYKFVCFATQWKSHTNIQEEFVRLFNFGGETNKILNPMHVL